jgi:hypothetical protein
MIKITSPIFMLSLCGLVTACLTRQHSSKSEAESSLEDLSAADGGKAKPAPPSFYTLKQGTKLQNAAPLPDRTEIMVNWTFSDGSQKTQEGFRGWDFDHDGRFEMLEVLDQNGKPAMWAYDFNADGVIDLVKKVENLRPKIDVTEEQGPVGHSPSVAVGH